MWFILGHQTRLNVQLHTPTLKLLLFSTWTFKWMYFNQIWALLFSIVLCWAYIKIKQLCYYLQFQSQWNILTNNSFLFVTVFYFKSILLWCEVSRPHIFSLAQINLHYLVFKHLTCHLSLFAFIVLSCAFIIIKKFLRS